MIITPTHHDAPFENPDAVELLIKEARVKTRRRRLRIGVVVLVVLIVTAATLIALGHGTTTHAPNAGSGPGNSVGTGATSVAVANLAGSNTITASGSHVWVSIDRESATSNYFAVTELNANNGSLVRVIKNKAGTLIKSGKNQKGGDLTEPGAMAVSGSHLWVADNQYWNVTEFNANNGALIRVINAKADGFAYPGAIAVGGGHVWVANSHVGANSITELNANNGSLVRVISTKAYGFDEPAAIAIGDGRVFVLNAGGDSITELNASSGALIGVINAHAGCCAPTQGTFEWAEPIVLTVSGPYLWVADQHNYANGGTSVSSVVELNASNGSLVRIIRAKADELNIPRAIAINRGHVWVQDGNNTLTELNASSGKLVRVISTKLVPDGFNSSDGLAVSGSHVSILNIYSGQKGSVTVLNAINGKLERVIK
jgi:hypothetical protein